MNLYVGALCRIVRSEAHPELVGQEVVISGRAYGAYADVGYEWVIRVRGISGDVGACSYNLEPILPDGLESIEDINALYEPSPSEVLANTGMRMEWQR